MESSTLGSQLISQEAVEVVQEDREDQEEEAREDREEEALEADTMDRVAAMGEAVGGTGTTVDVDRVVVVAVGRLVDLTATTTYVTHATTTPK